MFVWSGAWTVIVGMFICSGAQARRQSKEKEVSLPFKIS